MKLPDIHRTARYESLPKGLKAKADAIIKKKFGIKEERKTTVGGKTFVANGVDPIAQMAKELNGSFIQEYTPVNVNQFYTDSHTTMSSRPILRLVDLDYDYIDRVYRIRVSCRACGAVHTNTERAERVEGRGYGRTYTCRCGHAEYFVPDGEFYRAYKESMSRKQEDIWTTPGGLWL